MYSAKNQKEVFTQEVFLLTMLQHSDFLASKVPWREVSSRNLSKKILNGIFFRMNAEKLASRSIVAEKFVWMLRKRCSASNNAKISRKDFLAIKFFGKDPLEEKSNSNSSLKTWFPSRSLIWKLFEEILCRKAFWEVVSATIMLSMPASWLQRISFWGKMLLWNFLPSNRWCEQAFFQGTFLQANFFVRNPLFQDTVC
jgi:hypothetical protein